MKKQDRAKLKTRFHKKHTLATRHKKEKMKGMRQCRRKIGSEEVVGDLGFKKRIRERGATS